MELLAIPAGQPVERVAPVVPSEHSRDALAPYKRIRRLEFGDLPRTISGKIRRIELREATAAGSTAEYCEEDFR